MDILKTNPKGWLSWLDVAIVTISTLCNLIVLSGVYHGTFRLAGYKRFLFSLTLADLYICIVNISILTYDISTSFSSQGEIAHRLLRTAQIIGFFGNHKIFTTV